MKRYSSIISWSHICTWSISLIHDVEKTESLYPVFLYREIHPLKIAPSLLYIKNPWRKPWYNFTVIMVVGNPIRIIFRWSGIHTITAMGRMILLFYTTNLQYEPIPSRNFVFQYENFYFLFYFSSLTSAPNVLVSMTLF
jgi:hypothetical protein